MTVASLELCKELYELSGWESELTWATFKSYDDTTEHMVTNSDAGELGHDIWRISYAYDAGYLLRMLPKTIEIEHQEYYFVFEWDGIDESAVCQYLDDEYNVWSRTLSQFADTPEDAAAKLAIELWKQGILK